MAKKIEPLNLITIPVTNDSSTNEIVNYEIVVANIIGFRDNTILTARAKEIKTTLTAAQIENLMTTS